MSTLTDLLLLLFSSLHESGIQYCVLRNYDKLPDENIGSDIDVLIHENFIPEALNLLAKIDSVRITGLNRRAYVTTVFMDGIKNVKGQDSLQIDFVAGLLWKGFDYLKASEVLDNALSHHTHPLIKKPTPHHEALISLFSSYLLGGWIKDRYQNFVQEMFIQHEMQVLKDLAPWAGEEIASRLVAAVQNDQRDELLKILPQVRRRLLAYCLQRNPVVSLVQVARHYAYEFMIRFTSKPIREICILGMDGAGKSTVIDGVISRIGSRVKEVEVIHLKPKFSRGQGDGITVCSNPHALPSRSKFVSALKLLSWVAMYHLRRIFHGHKNVTLIIWDRYIYDVLVDPRRYRVDLPRWFLVLLIRLASAPQAVIVLDVAAEVAFARKPEVALENMYLIRQSYLNLIKDMPNAKIVCNAGNVDDAIEEMVEFVGSTLAQLVAKQKSA